jgi:23S rRNA pseudouridine2605 synthase
MTVKERVQKLMAQANLGSRRACEELIAQGRVRVNGKVIKLGDQADPAVDVIEVDGGKLKLPERKLYIAFNKPKYVLSTDEPHEGDTRKTVREFIPFEEHLFSIGRLDADTDGLMVLTNDGDLANRLSHPRYRHSKTYKVVVAGLPSLQTVEQWQRGVTLLEEDGTTFTTQPCYVKITDGDREATTLRVIMTEGKKRQIRRVATQLGHPVRSLTRTQIGQLQLGSLRSGEWRELSDADLGLLKKTAPEIGATKRATAAPKRRVTRPTGPASDRPKRSGGGKPARRSPAPPRKSGKRTPKS